MMRAPRPRVGVLLLLLSACSDGEPTAAPAALPCTAPAAAPEEPPARALGAAHVGIAPVKPFERWRVDRPDAPAVDVYVARSDERRPLVVYVQGSKCLPLFMVGPGRLVSTIGDPAAIVPLLSRVHFAVVERRGLTSFGKPPATEAEMQEEAQCTPEHGGVAKGERVADVADAIVALSHEAWVSSVSVVGHSEGADVAAGVGRVLGTSLTGVGLLSGAGITRFFDETVLARRTGNDDAVKQSLDDLVWITGPEASGDYRGASITRQLTYAVDSTPLDDLRGSAVPVFVAGGTRDDKAPIEGADAFVAELLRGKDRRVTYLLLPGLDHDLAKLDGAEHWNDVLSSFVDWLLTPDKPRAVTIRRF